MYSQYQQYRQPTATVTQQPGVVVNSASFPVSTVQQLATPVETYTTYYNGWTAREKEETIKANTLHGELKAEAQRQAAWAKYYADLSSRAAHHFYNSPGVAFPHGDLPPAPPAPIHYQSQQSRQINAIQQQSQFQFQQQTSTNSVNSTSTQQSPDGLKRYVHRCLSRCINKEQLLDMQKLVEERISAALNAGTMHTTDWEEQELLPLKINSSKYTSQPTQVPLPNPKNYSSENNGDSSFSQPAALSTSYYGENKQRNQTGDTTYYSYSNPTNESKCDQASLSGDFIAFSKKETKGERKAAKLSIKLETAKKKLESAKAKKKRTVDDALGFELSNSALAKRAHRFAGAGGISEASAAGSSLNGEYAKYMGKSVIGGSTKGELDEDDYVRMTVKGTCVRLEKEYLRLTAPPKAELVRPQGILEKHLQNLQTSWNSPERRDYVWFCSQLKAIRQDMTVQRIFNGFAVQVYETHARIALEQGDLNEYNQCQTQLKELYTKQDNNVTLTNMNEFIAFRLIYYVHQTGNKKYEGGSSDLFKIMLSLTLEQRGDPCIAHALEVRAAVAEFDYHAFFTLLKACPSKHATFLMKFLVPNVRYWALQRICKAYRPSVSLNFVLQELGFDSDGVEKGKTWLESCGVVMTQDEIVTKDTVVHESILKAQNSLI